MAARGLINFAELLECMASFTSASQMMGENKSQIDQISAAQTAAVTAAAESDDWMLPARALGDLDAVKVYSSLDDHARQMARRPFNQNQKQAILHELTFTGAGMVEARNPNYKNRHGEIQAGETEFIEVPIDPPLEGARRHGIIDIDPAHRRLREIKAEYGEGARDAVIQCRKEQIDNNDSGNYVVRKIMDPETGKEMLPGVIIARMAVWLPGCLRVRYFTPGDPGSWSWQIFQISDGEGEIKAALRARGILAAATGGGRRDKVKIYLQPMQEIDFNGVAEGVAGTDEDLLVDGETLGDKIDVVRDLRAGSLDGFAVGAAVL